MATKQPAGDASSDGSTQPEAAATVTAATAADPGAAPAEAGEEDLKAKYREALERKKGGHASAAGGAHGGGKAGHAESAHSSQRMFRRKSGG